MANKKIPMRQCVGCRELKPKKDMIRVKKKLALFNLSIHRQNGTIDIVGEEHHKRALFSHYLTSNLDSTIDLTLESFCKLLNISPDSLRAIVHEALQTENASMAGFVPDETVTVRDLLYGAMLPSGAECCEALAQLVSGSEENFAALMNQKAAELGMKNTHFTNATGLTDTEHYSSAADMAKLLQAALHNTTFRTIFTTEHYTTNATAQHPEGVSLTSTLLGKLDGTELPAGTQIKGGKTGYTAAAGLCLASLATVNGKEYILVTLAAPGDHGTEQYNIRDAVHVYRKLADKK